MLTKIEDANIWIKEYTIGNVIKLRKVILIYNKTKHKNKKIIGFSCFYSYQGG